MIEKMNFSFTEWNDTDNFKTSNRDKDYSTISTLIVINNFIETNEIQ